MLTALTDWLGGSDATAAGRLPARSFSARILLAVLAIAVLPTLIAGVLGYVAVGTHLTTAAYATLQANSKNYAQGLVGRMQQLQLSLRALDRELVEGAAPSTVTVLSERMEAIFLIAADGRTVRPLLGGVVKPTFIERLRSNVALLAWETAGGTKVALVHPLPDGRKLVAVPRAEALWGELDTLPYGVATCVLAARSLEVLWCPEAPRREIGDALRGSTNLHGAHFEVATATGPALAASHELFLGPFRTEQSWLVVATVPEAIALQAVNSFRAVFPSLVLLVALAATLLGLREVRRRTAPLAELLTAAGHIANNDFETPIAVASDDEFGLLATHLEAMTANLRNSFGTLRALASVDQSILTEPNIVAVAERVLRHCTGALGAPIAALLLAPRRRDAERAGATSTAQLFTLRGGGIVQQCSIDSYTPPPFEIASTRFADLGTLLDRVEPQPAFAWSFPIWQQDRVAGWLLLGATAAAISPRADLNELAQRVAVAIDVLDGRAQLHERANFDSLTGLPNRQFFRELLTGAVIRSRRHTASGALMFVDLDNFKIINDTEGHRAGDEVLREVARRLTATLRATDTVARLGGDEFTVILEDLQRPSDVSRMAENLIAAVSKPIRLAHAEVAVSASIGITLFPEDADDADTLIVNADLAMYRVKETGRNGLRFFSDDMNARVRERRIIETRLRTTLRVGGFSLVYQPQLDARNGAVIGAEALLRWHDAELGHVAPARFIPIAEETGLIVDIGHWILRQICSDYSQWKARGIAPQRIAMNVSQRQFATPTFVRDLHETLDAAGMDPRDLELEVTESILAKDVENVWQKLSQLRDRGVRIALDDFGTGYSSLNLLRRLPVDVIKIDKSFVDEVEHSADARSIVSAIAAMSHALDKALVAEGVETEGQVAFLHEIGCDACQGYLFSVPLDAEALANFLRVRRFKAAANG